MTKFHSLCVILKFLDSSELSGSFLIIVYDVEVNTTPKSSQFQEAKREKKRNLVPRRKLFFFSFELFRRFCHRRRSREWMRNCFSVHHATFRTVTRHQSSFVFKVASHVLFFIFLCVRLQITKKLSGKLRNFLITVTALLCHIKLLGKQAEGQVGQQKGNRAFTMFPPASLWTAIHHDGAEGEKANFSDVCIQSSYEALSASSSSSRKLLLPYLKLKLIDVDHQFPFDFSYFPSFHFILWLFVRILFCWWQWDGNEFLSKHFP